MTKMQYQASIWNFTKS